jgi:hypothetical protein
MGLAAHLGVVHHRKEVDAEFGRFVTLLPESSQSWTHWRRIARVSSDIGISFTPSFRIRTKMPQVGDKVYPANSKMRYEINHVSHDGAEVNLHVPGTNLERFRVRTNSLTFADRNPPARTSNPFTSPEPVLDVDEILKRIATVQEENLKRLDDDIDILKAYLAMVILLRKIGSSLVPPSQLVETF